MKLRRSPKLAGASACTPVAQRKGVYPGARLAVLTTGLLRSFAARLERRRDNAADAASRETGGSLELGDNDIFGDGGYF